jgi:hypothetical protein
MKGMSKHSQLSEDRKSKMMDMTMQFGKTVWLLHLLATSMDAEESQDL